MNNILPLVLPVGTRVTDAHNPAAPSNAEIAEGLSASNLHLLEAAYHTAALIASEDDSPPTLAELEDLDALSVFMEELASRN